jgi:elongation factor P
MSDEEVGEQGKYLREGLEVHISTFEERPVAIELPRKLTFKVVEASDASAGNTVSGGNMFKEVGLDGGLRVMVPLFIKQGENIIINTDTGEYVERA